MTVRLRTLVVIMSAEKDIIEYNILYGFNCFRIDPVNKNIKN